ncbi:hypothetical protein [Nostoc foliaceum]|uniref:Transposase n=1 Tax=Nostoc foliaceum FACHB-393 TaxID=2692915 RepID=A0ABR8IL34_9NOSO|nr:hypothetical protein [Nostoc foliaceum]MBD2651696.1 hypothetical protein [Nostoc foliaceum FACHB-393]
MKIGLQQYWNLLVDYLKPQKERVFKFAIALLISIGLPDFSRDVGRGVWFANVIREPNSHKNDLYICWYCRHRCE